MGRGRVALWHEKVQTVTLAPTILDICPLAGRQLAVETVDSYGPQSPGVAQTLRARLSLAHGPTGTYNQNKFLFAIVCAEIDKMSKQMKCNLYICSISQMAGDCLLLLCFNIYLVLFYHIKLFG